jgi:hypothetical protein
LVQAYAKNDLGVDYFETSAKEGVNVEEAFLRLAEQMKKRFVACLRSSEVCRFVCLPFPANLALAQQICSSTAPNMRLSPPGLACGPFRKDGMTSSSSARPSGGPTLNLDQEPAKKPSKKICSI